MIGHQSSTFLEQSSTVSAVELEVIGEVILHFLDVRPCLIQCEWEPSQFLRDLKGGGTITNPGLLKLRIRGKEPGATQQEQRSHCLSQRLYFDAARQPPHAGCACRQQCVSSTGRWKEVLDEGEVVSIIEDQQPAVMRLEPVFDRLDDF